MWKDTARDGLVAAVVVVGASVMKLGAPMGLSDTGVRDCGGMGVGEIGEVGRVGCRWLVEDRG